MSNYKKVPKNLDYLKKGKTANLERIDLVNPEELSDIKYNLSSPEELFGKEAMKNIQNAVELPSPAELFTKASLDSDLPQIEDLLGQESLANILSDEDDSLLSPERLFKEETKPSKKTNLSNK